MRMKLSTTAVALAISASVSAASAQTMLTHQEIVNSLQGVQQEATLNPEELKAMALQNIERNPGENAPSGIPMSSLLGNLKQFNVQIDFDFDSARILPKSYEAIGTIADALHTPYLAEQKFLIIGHTDAKGARKYNLELSQRRADAVRNALVTTFMIEPHLLSAVGLGEEQMADPANPDAAVNRRVQLINIGF